MIQVGRFPGPEYPIQQVPAVNAQVPTRILYLLVQYSIVNNVIQNYPTYGPNSGIYFLGAGLDLFVQNLVQGQYPTNPHIPVPGSGIPTIDCATHVVFLLDPAGELTFWVDANGDAVMTNDSNNATNQNASYDYVNLTHVMNDGSPYNGAINPHPPNQNLTCRIVHFVANYGPPQTTPTTDYFNLYANLNGMRKVIDPEIKNTGHPPPQNVPPRAK